MDSLPQQTGGGGVPQVVEPDRWHVNEERQLRLGQGQVLRYQFLMSRAGVSVTPVLMGERQPRDTTWVKPCGALGVVLLWGPAPAVEGSTTWTQLVTSSTLICS